MEEVQGQCQSGITGSEEGWDYKNNNEQKKY